MAGKKASTTKSRVTQDVGGGGSSVVMSLRLEAAMHERLRKLAFDRRGSMREFILRGIEEVLKAEKY